ncbi:hypothetical protein [Tolypothrix tenuis]
MSNDKPVRLNSLRTHQEAIACSKTVVESLYIIFSSKKLKL